jgi:hypothetical protein
MPRLPHQAAMPDDGTPILAAPVAANIQIPAFVVLSIWNNRANRSQVSDGTWILGFVVPIVISLMMGRPNELWCDPCYPVVDA